MRIGVIGCGSIGQRHIRNLVSLGAGTIFAFDADAEKLSASGRISPSVEPCGSMDLLWTKAPELVFVTVPTSLHIQFAVEAARRGCHLFIEKPLSDNCGNVDPLLELVEKKELITLVGCNMRFHWAIARIKSLLEEGAIGRALSARMETGQYLPDWHPWEDYRNMYCARKDLGGGVFLDSIHEIDYAIWFFGPVADSTSMYGKLSDLEIETEDVAEIVLKLEAGPVANIHMDYLQRHYARSCKIIGKEGTISWDIHDKAVKVYRAETGRWDRFSEPQGYDMNQMYVDETLYLLDCVEKQKPTFNDVRQGLETLKVAMNAKANGVEVKP